jgi:hypothetical protein
MDLLSVDADFSTFIDFCSIGCRNASVHERLRASVRGSFRRLLGVWAHWGQQGERSAFFVVSVVVLRIQNVCPGSGFFHLGSSAIRPRIRIRICNKEFKYRYLYSENWKYDPGCLSLIRIFAVPDPGVRKHRISNLDPQHCSLVPVLVPTYPTPILFGAVFITGKAAGRYPVHVKSVFLPFLELSRFDLIFAGTGACLSFTIPC